MSDILSIPQDAIRHNKSIFYNLFVSLLLCVIVLGLIQLYWRRRRLYRISRKIPGPPALPLLGNGHLFIGPPDHIYTALQKLMNDFPKSCRLWLGMRLYYVYQQPNDIERIMTSQHALAKDHLYKYGKTFMGDGLLTAPVGLWKKHRKLIMPTFNQRILDGFVEVFNEQSVILTEELRNVAGKGVFDLFQYISSCTIDIICETAMGVQVHAQRQGVQVGKWIDSLMEISVLRIFYIPYHFDFIFNMSKYKAKEDDLLKKFHTFTGDVVKAKRKAYEREQEEQRLQPEAHIEDSTTRKAFLDLLIDYCAKKGEHLTEQEFRDEVDTFVVAGSDTTASSLCYLLMNLGLHKDVQAKVYEEIIDILGPDRTVESSDLPKMKYTERAIKESLRLFPIGLFVARHLESDIEMDDGVAPAGASAFIAILNVHRNGEFWPDPLKYDPDRFLPEETAKRHPFAYLPFSAGPRNCIGMKYGMMAMKTLLAAIIRKYEIHTTYKSVEDVKLKTNVILRPCEGYKVYITLRDD